MLSIIVLCALFYTSVNCVQSLTQLTGVKTLDLENVYDPSGYVLFSPNLYRTTYLINLEGDIVHEWKLNHFTGDHVTLYPDGHLIAAGKVPLEERANTIGGSGGYITEYDWDSNVVWEHKIADTEKGVLAHHTFHRRENGNVLILCNERVPFETMKALGRNEDTIPDAPVNSRGVLHDGFFLDYAVEIDPSTGETVWEWHMLDHIGTGYNKFNPNHVLPASTGAMMHGPDWSHFNTLTMNEETNLVMMVSRNFGEFYQVSYETGEIVYRWGNPSAWNPDAKIPSYADDGDRELFGPHHATFLPNGNVQVFDNGVNRPTGSYSRVLEVDTTTGEIVWQYQSWDGSSFFSAFQSSAYRQPNGNVLVTATNVGHLFEVTPDGKVVWDYINPVIAKGERVCVMRDDDLRLPALGFHHFMTNMIHRAMRVPSDWPGLQGKDLSVKEVMIPGCPKLFEIDPDRIAKKWEAEGLTTSD